MKKLRLELDALRVESFSTAGEARGRGTVHGNAPVEPPELYTQSEDPVQCQTQGYTCLASCNGSCNSCYSCDGTCHGSCLTQCDPSCNRCFPEYPEQFEP